MVYFFTLSDGEDQTTYNPLVIEEGRSEETDYQLYSEDALLDVVEETHHQSGGRGLDRFGEIQVGK